MAETPPYTWPEPQPPAKKSNATLIWIIVIVGIAALCLLTLLMAAVLFPVFSQARLAAQRSACLSNIKQTALGHLMYSVDNNDRFPPALNWMDSIQPFTRDEGILHCPVLIKESPTAYGFGFSKVLAGWKTEKLTHPEATFLLFESDVADRSFSGGRGDVAVPGRHMSRGNFAYCDGHAKAMDPSEARDMGPPDPWKP